ncbi:MAG: glycoside hydrolase family 27 protein [Lachnospiraceae bacterium]|nr:glycoside hydrolase family 27 protein [Lachnospiraceae bacterium]
MSYDKNACAPRPPMGWNSYDYYDTTVTEDRVLANAEYMAKELKAFGWEYIVVDIEWYAPGAGSQRDKFQYIPFSKLAMDEYSRLLPDPERFPSSKDGAGFKPLADKVHALGLKFGIHIMRGIPRQAAHAHTKLLGTELTAADVANPSSISRWNPDMYGVRDCEAGQAYYNSIFELYASWGVDFIKCDDICNTNAFADDRYTGKHEVEMIAKAIEGCGRPMVLSLSPGPALIDKAWHYEKFANMWRITDDFWDRWDLLKDMFTRCELWERHVSAGNYPDCDMLTLGKLGKGFGAERDCNFTPDEQKTMLSLWCIFGSPLMIGAELTLLDEATKKLLCNKDILSLLDPYRIRRQLYRDEDKAAWESKSHDGKDRVVALFNLSEEERVFTIPGCEKATELWSGESVSASEIRLSPHACGVYRIS